MREGLTTLRAWLQPRTKLVVLCILTLFAYAAAISREQALPWGVAALLLATVIVGTAWPHWLVRAISVVRSGPTRAEEGDTINFHVDVENHGWLPRFMVELVDRLPFVGAAKGSLAIGEQTLGIIGFVPGGGRRNFRMPLLCEKRGFYQLGPVGLASGFPLGLTEARQGRNAGVQTLTIYPDVFTIIDLPLRGAPSQIHRGGYLLPEGAGAAEFSGLREYRRGDNPRHVHWPTTARMNELMVREYEPLASACIYLALDLGRDANVGKGKQATFEYAVRIAGSIARHTCGNNLRTRLLSHGADWLEIPAGSGEMHYSSILDTLAVIDADGALPYAKVIEHMAWLVQAGETVVVFLSEPTERMAETLQALALLRGQRVHLLAIVLDRTSFAGDGQSAGQATSNPYEAALIELGATCFHVRCGDDLSRVFNS